MHCETVKEDDGDKTMKPWKFDVPYDKLVIGCRAEPTTFGIHGVREHAIFLREVRDAQEIGRKLLLRHPRYINVGCKKYFVGIDEWSDKIILKQGFLKKRSADF